MHSHYKLARKPALDMIIVTKSNDIEKRTTSSTNLIETTMMIQRTLCILCGGTTNRSHADEAEDDAGRLADDSSYGQSDGIALVILLILLTIFIFALAYILKKW